MTNNGHDFTGDKNPNFRTGLKVKGNELEGIYNSWQNMKGRCLRKSHPKYPRYGGRGITIHPDWLDIKNFYKWAVESGWSKGKSIDRIDNNGNYEPGNCRWISISENSRKKRTTKLTFEQAATIRQRIQNGENMYDLAKEYNVVHGTIWFIQNGFTHVAENECTNMLKYRLSKKK